MEKREIVAKSVVSWGYESANIRDFGGFEVRFRGPTRTGGDLAVPQSRRPRAPTTPERTGPGAALWQFYGQVK